MKNNLQRELKGWLRHWYLGGGSSSNRALLDKKARKIEPKAFKCMMSILGDAEVIFKDATPLS